jgi:hypothetical protein
VADVVRAAGFDGPVEVRAFASGALSREAVG